MQCAFTTNQTVNQQQTQQQQEQRNSLRPVTSNDLNATSSSQLANWSVKLNDSGSTDAISGNEKKIDTSSSSPVVINSVKLSTSALAMASTNNITGERGKHFRDIHTMATFSISDLNSTQGYENSTNVPDDDSISVLPAEIPFAERFELCPLLLAFGLALLVLIYFSTTRNRIEHSYMFATVLVAGFGNLGAGFVLSTVQHWPVFFYVSELLVLAPTLLGLKGNIEMCMASRLATQANLGNMKSWRETIKMIWGNLGLDLTQATTVACIAATSVLLFDAVSSKTFNLTVLYNASILISSSMLTAVTTSFLLGSLLVTVIVLSYRMKMNPDNIASPVAASLGDVITLTFLASYSSLIFNFTETPPAVPLPGLIIVTVLLILLPLWFTCAYVNPYTKPSMWSGWTPIFVAVLISTCSGFILDAAVLRFTRYSVFQPVMNGIGGNLVAVHASRMSTTLHKSSSPGALPSGVKLFRSPLAAFWDKQEANIEMARNLVAMAVPAHVIYILITVSLKTNIVLTNYFLIFYIASAVIQIIILLYFATHLVNLMWKFGIDPDNTSIPILTATGDFLGSLFLYFTFLAMEKLNDVNAS